MVAVGNILSSLFAAGSWHASQTLLGDVEHSLSSTPPTGNIPYVLPSERTFLLNVPEDYTHDDPLPLVLSFHGGESGSVKYAPQLSWPRED